MIDKKLINNFLYNISGGVEILYDKYLDLIESDFFKKVSVQHKNIHIMKYIVQVSRVYLNDEELKLVLLKSKGYTFLEFLSMLLDGGVEEMV